MKIIKTLLTALVFTGIMFTVNANENNQFKSATSCIKMYPGVLENIRFFKQQRKEALFKIQDMSILDLTTEAKTLSDLRYRLVIQGEQTGCEDMYSAVIKEIDKFKEVYIRELRHRGIPDIALDFI